MADPKNNQKTADLKLERNSETFRRFDELRVQLGYTSLKAGIFAAMNFMLLHYEKHNFLSQEHSQPASGVG